MLLWRLREATPASSPQRDTPCKGNRSRRRYTALPTGNQTAQVMSRVDTVGSTRLLPFSTVIGCRNGVTTLKLHAQLWFRCNHENLAEGRRSSPCGEWRVESVDLTPAQVPSCCLSTLFFSLSARKLFRRHQYDCVNVAVSDLSTFTGRQNLHTLPWKLQQMHAGKATSSR